jgi:hypothetical protein
LTQLIGSWNCLVAYLPKQLDAVSWGWLPCLHTLAATAILVAEAAKLTLGQEHTVRVPHSVLTLMEYKGNYWLTNSQMVRYQSMLCENPCIQLEIVKTLTLATLLTTDSGLLEHDWLEALEEVYSSQPHLTDQLISHLDVKYFTDSNSFVQDGTYFARYAVVTLDTVTESCPLPVGTSAQKAELTTLTWALHFIAGEWINI